MKWTKFQTWVITLLCYSLLPAIVSAASNDAVIGAAKREG